MKSNKGFNLVSVIIIICITSITSAITAGVIVTNNYNLSYSKLADDEKLGEFLKAYSNIVNNYYEDIDTSGMLDSALSAMLKYLGDNYTTYLDENLTENLSNELAGNSYQGIGITIEGKKIIRVLKDTPADKAGIMAGDIITNINNKEITDNNYISIPTYIKENKTANLIIDRNGESINVSVSSSSIDTPNVYYEMINENTGYLSMDIFSNTLPEQAKKGLNYLEKNGMNRLIIDLRNNTGGYLESAEKIASMFLEKGKIIYSLQDKNSKKEYKDKTEEKKTYPIIILLNEESASASEILAAALKDSYGATLIGKTSFGKGKVQQTYELNGGSMAKYTSAKWLTPKGVCIDGKGLTPDYEVDNEIIKDEAGVEIGVTDTQLEKAKELISAM